MTIFWQLKVIIGWRGLSLQLWGWQFEVYRDRNKLSWIFRFLWWNWFGLQPCLTCGLILLHFSLSCRVQLLKNNLLLFSRIQYELYHLFPFLCLSWVLLYTIVTFVDNISSSQLCQYWLQFVILKFVLQLWFFEL